MWLVEIFHQIGIKFVFIFRKHGVKSVSQYYILYLSGFMEKWHCSDISKSYFAIFPEIHSMMKHHCWLFSAIDTQGSCMAVISPSDILLNAKLDDLRDPLTQPCMSDMASLHI